MRLMAPLLISMMSYKKLTGLWVLAACFLTGCGRPMQQVVTITQTPYEKLIYETDEVKRGDISSSVTLELVAEGYEYISYKTPKEEIALQEVYVSAGDRVKAGELLVSFESEQIRETVKAYEETKGQKELLIQHYKELMKIEGSVDYEVDIKMLQEDIRVAELYIEEAERKLAEYQIVAEADGIVENISDYLHSGVIKQGAVLMEQVTGTGRYLASTAEAGVFVEGEIYTAVSGNMEYALCLQQIDGEELIFVPQEGEHIVSMDEELTLTLQLPELEDVVYVNRHAVCKAVDGDAQGTHFVYLMDEQGYQRAVYVTVGERVGDNIIIKNGLYGGEKVVIR